MSLYIGSFGQESETDVHTDTDTQTHTHTDDVKTITPSADAGCKKTRYALKTPLPFMYGMSVILKPVSLIPSRK